MATLLLLGLWAIAPSGLDAAYAQSGEEAVPKELLTLIPTTKDRPWIAYKNGDITSFYRKPIEESQVKELTEKFEGLEKAIAKTIPQLVVKQKYTLYFWLYRSWDEMKKVLPVAAKTPGVYYHQRRHLHSIPNIVAGRKPAAIVLHEYFHHYINKVYGKNYPHVPEWLNEGLANYFCRFEIDPKTHALIKNHKPRYRKIKRLLKRADNKITIERVLREPKLTESDRNLAATVCAFLIEYVGERKDAYRLFLRTMLDSLRLEDTSEKKALEKALKTSKVDLGQMNRDWVEFVRRYQKRR